MKFIRRSRALFWSARKPSCFPHSAPIRITSSKVVRLTSVAGRFLHRYNTSISRKESDDAQQRRAKTESEGCGWKSKSSRAVLRKCKTDSESTYMGRKTSGACSRCCAAVSGLCRDGSCAAGCATICAITCANTCATNCAASFPASVEVAD